MTETDKKIKEEFDNLPKGFWDFKDSTTNDLTHGLHNYPATMIYPIPRNIINIVKKHKNIETMLDPFVGSGTILVEGQLSGISTLYGTDLNPLGVLLTKAKTTPLNESQIFFMTKDFKDKIKSLEQEALKTADELELYIENELNLDVTAKDGWGKDAEKYIGNFFETRNKPFNYCAFKNIGYWFKPYVIILLQSIKYAINEITDNDVKNFLYIVLSETIRLVSNTRNGEFKLFRMEPKKVASFHPDVFTIFLTTLDRNISKMEDFLKEYHFKSLVHVNVDDTRILNSVPDNSIDLIVTSPPYGDSHTTVAYGQFSRLSLQWLDLDVIEQKDINSLDRTLLGGKPIKSSDGAELGSATLCESLEKIAAKDPARAKEVYYFYADLDLCLKAISKKMKKGSYQFWVVGNRTVKLVQLRTDFILIEMFEKYGIKHLFSFERNISNKVMPSLNSPTNVSGELAPTMLNETIVVLKKE